MSIREMENKGDVVAGVYYQSHSQDVSTDELFYTKLGEISGSVVLVLMGDFNFLDISWKYHTVVMSNYWKFLTFVGDITSCHKYSVSQLGTMPS